MNNIEHILRGIDKTEADLSIEYDGLIKKAKQALKVVIDVLK